MANESLSHLDQRGHAHMVDVGEKAVSQRTAIASGHVRMAPNTLALLADDAMPKGDVLATARIAGIQAAKRTSELIPLCHLLALSSVKIDFVLDSELPGVRIQARCKMEGRTGVEMEALTAVSVAALTLYDMCKAVDKAMVIGAVQLEHKEGGKSGDWHRKTADDAQPAPDQPIPPASSATSSEPSAPARHAAHITVLLFAALREALGEQRLELPFSELTSPTLDGLKQALVARDPRFSALYDQQVLSAVNQRICKGDTPLSPGDEVGFFPPVTGG
ncbi:cyclic pyranopterin monophosphate synthase MoaC [Carnimonas bestiolae]|uniref:cyclic pyranopterin monophosphate synthase MoaC n=1 Tax=Carnimonas bestiolae TaxID=3402172 RepID=UPI003EDB9744